MEQGQRCNKDRDAMKLGPKLVRNRDYWQNRDPQQQQGSLLLAPQGALCRLDVSDRPTSMIDPGDSFEFDCSKLF